MKRLVKTITNKEEGTMFQIYKMGKDSYGFVYLEKFTNGGWRQVFEEYDFSKEAIEWEFDTEVK